MKRFSATLAIVAAALIAYAPIAEAKSFGGFRGGSSFRSSSIGRSYSRPSTSSGWFSSKPKAVTPAPTYRAPAYSRPSTVYNSTTVVQQSAGGGFFSSMFGSIAGFGIAQWLFGDDEKPAQVTPPAVPAVPAVPAAPVETPKAQ